MKAQRSVRERILDTASNLFYSQGYQATGINQIIKEANIAKASLYQQFPSKDDLLNEYLSISSDEWFSAVHAAIPDKVKGKKAILDLFKFRISRLKNNNLKGCSFIRLSYELPNLEGNGLQIIKKHKLAVKDFIRKNVKCLEKPLSSAKAEELTEVIFNLLEGCSVQASILKTTEPVEKTIRFVKKLLE